MKTTLVWTMIVLTIVFTLALFVLLPHTVAEDYTQLGLPEGATARLGKGGIQEIAYSPNGALLVVTGSAGTWLYDAATYQERELLSDHTTTVQSVAFSPDGKTIATGSQFSTVLLWDVATNTHKHTLTGHRGNVYSVAFSPDSTTIASGSLDGTVRLSDVNTGAHIRTLTEHTGGINSVAFSPDGTIIASGSNDFTIRLWNAKTGTHIRTLTGHTGSVESVAFSPDGTTIASGSSDDTIRLWNANTGAHIRSLTGHTYSVNSVAFSPDGKTIASGSWDFTIRLWNAKTGAHIRTLTGHTYSVNSVAFSPDGKTIASGSWDFTIRLWNAKTGTHIRTLTGYTDQVESVAFSPDGNTIASGSIGEVRLWDVATATHKETLKVDAGWLLSVAFSPDGKTIASGSYDNTVRLWDVATATHKETLTGHTDWVLSVAFSPDGKTIATGSRDNTVRLWDVATATHKETLTGHTDYVLSVAFSPDGKTIATGSSDNTVRLWDVDTATHKETLTGHINSVWSVAFSPDGKTIASGSSLAVRLWDVATATHKERLAGHTDWVLSVAFSPDGTTLATGSFDNTVRLWDVATAMHKETLIGHTDRVDSVAFSPDGTTLASGSGDGTVLLWDVTQYIDIVPVTPDPVDTPSPTVTILTPSEGQTYDHGTPTITGNFSGAAAPISLKLTLNGTAVEAEISETEFTYTPTDVLETGEYTLSAEVTDANGNSAKATVTFNVQLEDPLEETSTDTELPSVDDPSLILYLSFDERNGNQTIDHSRYQNNGTLVGNPQLVDGKFGKALQLDGENDYVEVTHHDSLTVDEAFTVMAWIQTPRYQGNSIWQGIIAKSNSPRSYSFYIESGNLHISVGSWVGSVSTEMIALNEWQHVVAQFDNGWHRYWINGKNVGNLEIGGTLPGGSDTENVLIGNTHELSRHFLGLIDEVRVYNRALPEEEIMQLMHTGFQPSETELITETYLKEDVNSDGVVDVRDLALVAADLTLIGEYVTDVNEDGAVNIADLVLVAGASVNNTTAATAAVSWTKLGGTTFTPSRADVQAWLEQARQLNLTDPKSLRGIRFLEQLLLALTPKKTALLANYPNPFNPETWIPYQLAKSASVNVSIYAADGKLIRRLTLGHQVAGVYHARNRAVHWDGKNSLGESVASGVYFYTLTAGDFSATRRMLILK